MLEKLFDKLKKISKKSEVDTDNCGIEEKRRFIVEKLFPLLEMQSDVLVTVTGLKHYFGSQPFEIGKKIHLIKEPGNRYDSNAIMAICEGVGKCGYVANNEHTVKQGTVSAQVLSGGISESCVATVLWCDEWFSVCELEDISFYSILLKYAIDYCYYEEFELALDLLLAMEKKFGTAEIYRRIAYCYIKINDKKKANIYAQKAQSLDKDDKNLELLFIEINK